MNAAVPQLPAMTGGQAYRSILDAADEAFFVHEPRTGAILDVNAAALQMFGYTREEILGVTLAKLSEGQPPYTPERAAESIRRAVAEGPQRFEWRCRHRDGSVFWAEVSLKHTELAGQPRVVAVARHIDERKRAESYRAANERRMAMLLDLNHRLPELDEQQICNEAVEIAAEVTGSPLACLYLLHEQGDRFELAGRKGEESCGDEPAPPPDWRKGVRYGAALLHNGGPRATDGAEKGWERFLGVPVVDGGATRLMLLVGGREEDYQPTDVEQAQLVASEIWQFIEQRRVETALDRTREELSALNRTLERRVAEEVIRNREKDQLMIQQARLAQMGEMLSMIAHQWRQPLTAVSASVVHLKLKSDMGRMTAADVDETAATVQLQTRHMSETINQFIEFLSPDHNPAPFRLVDVFDAVRSLVEPQLRNRGIGLNVDLPDRATLFGYPKELEQVLLNLLGNARDAYDDRPGSIEVLARRTQDGWHIEVRDQAGGIAPEVLDRIFDPYFSTKPPGQGTGLGLYVSRLIVEQRFGGQLRVDSDGGATRFSIILPDQGTVP